MNKSEAESAEQTQVKVSLGTLNQNRGGLLSKWGGGTLCSLLLMLTQPAQGAGELTLQCAPDKTVACGTAWDFNAPSASTTCDPNTTTVTVLSTVTNYTCGESFTATRTWSATDQCGNTETCGQTVSVVDTTPPQITCAQPKTVLFGSDWAFDPPAASDECVFYSLVYDDSVNDLATRFDPGTTEVGDEIILEGRARYLSSFTLEYWGTSANSSAFEGQVQARLRFYRNDGPLVSGYASPASLLYDSGEFPVVPTSRATLTFNDFSRGVVPLAGPVPDSFTWSIQFSGMTGSDHAGVDLFSPPVVGRDYTDYWEKTSAESWELRADSGGLSMDFAAMAYASNQLAVVVVSTVTNYTCGQAFNATRTWSAIDPCGNSNTCSQTVSVIDITAPQLNCPANKTVELGLPWSFDVPTASDNCVFNSLVYDDSVNDLVTRFDPGTLEVGDEIILAGSDRHLTSFALEYWGTSSSGSAFEGAVKGRVRFYLNDGAPASSGYPAPGTVLFDSGDFALGPTARSTLLFSDFVTDTVVPLGVALPNSFTWSIQFSGMTGGDHVGVDLYSPPVVGQSYPDYWENTGSTWDLRTNETVSMDFAAVAYANQLSVEIVSTVTNTSRCPGTFQAIRTWQATDPCNNSSSCSQTVSVQDTTAPVITVPAPLVLTNDANQCGALVNYSVSATDLGSAVPVECTPPSGVPFPIGTTTVNCAAWDACNNTNRASFTVTVRDVELPVLNLPASFVIDLTNGCRQEVTYTVVATDNCAVTNLTCAPASGSMFAVGTTAVACLAKDASGNSRSGSFNVTVRDRIAPVVVCSTNVVANLASGCSRTVSYPVFMPTDNCQISTFSCSPKSGSSFHLGTTVVTCTATDRSGNVGSCSFTVTVNDTIPPVIVAPNVLTNTTAGCSQVVNYAPTATDNCTLTNLTCTPASGSTFPVGTNSVTCVAKDAQGNTSTSTFSVIVQDTILPQITVPADLLTNSANLLCGQRVPYPAASATDNCTLRSLSCAPPSGSIFAVGTNIVTCTASDTAGNTNTATFKIVVLDLNPPVITAANILTNTTGSCGQLVNFVPKTSDGCGVTNVTCTPPSGSSFGVGATLVTCVASDRSGNTASCTFTVTVRDLEAPVVSAPDVVTNTTGQCGQVVEFAPATDNCTITNLTCTPASGSAFALGTTLVTCVALDSSGNMGSNSFTVTVRDVEPPALELPASFVMDLTNGCQQEVTYTAVATDNCAVTNFTCMPPSGSSFRVGTTAVACLAKDASGNSRSGSFNVTVRDRIAPVVVCSTNVVANLASGCSRTVSYPVFMPTDNCQISTFSCIPKSGSSFPLGTTVVTCTATDRSGNVGSCSFTVTVNDTIPPVILAPNVLTNTTGQCSQVVEFATPTATDNCTVTNVSCTPASGSTFALGTTVVTCVAKDGSGNTGQGVFNVEVVDGDAPAITCPADILGAVSEPVTRRAVVTWTAPSATDGCSSVSVTCQPASGSFFPVGSSTVVCTATDGAGNSSSCSFTVTVNKPNFITQVQQGSGASWTNAIWTNTLVNAPAVPPAAGNTYECVGGGSKVPTRIRCPAGDGVQTFPGDSLTINALTDIRAKKGSANNTVINFPGVDGNPGLILNGGTLDVGDDWICGLAGKIYVQADSFMMCGDNNSTNRGWRIEGQLTGSGGLTVSNPPGTGPAMNIVSSNNVYTGTWTIYGGVFKATGVNSLGFGNIIVNPGTNRATFEVMYDVMSPGTLTLASGNVKMILHQNCTFSAVTIAGTPLSTGTHPYAELVANFPDSFNTGGSGSITVGPMLPVFFTSPANQTVNAGSPATFSVTAYEPTSVTYAWLANGTVVPGAAEPTYTFTPTTADNGKNFQAVLSNPAGSVTSLVATLTVIPPPGPSHVTTVGGLNDITVSWDSQAGATNYLVRRAATAGGPYVDVGATSQTSLVDSGLASGSVYYYEVRSQGISGESVYSDPVIAYTIPPVTTGLIALPGDTQVTLNWSPTAGAISYKVKRSSSTGGPYTTLATVTTLAYIDTGLVNLSENYYVVSAVNAAGEGLNSSEVLGIPGAAPAGVVATGGTNANFLQWTAFTGATSYNVKRATTSGGPYSTLQTGLATPSYQDLSLPNGTIYYYIISAQLAGGESANSVQVSALTAPSAPTGFAITATNYTAVTLVWTFNDPVPATSFIIEQSKEGAAFTVAGTAAGSERTYTANNLDQGRSYTFRVRAVNATGFSPYSGTADSVQPNFLANINFGTAAMPDYPGYLKDGGLAYGLRPNGYTYGFDIDNTANARYRQNALSPDLRYDTLNHLQKTTPGRTWEMAVPTGDYRIHVVAGDPTATDTTAQFNIEGVITEALPMIIGTDTNHWREFTVGVHVSDGKLTVTSGPLASNNKICYLDILLPEAPAITGQPQDLAVSEGQSATFTVQATGAPVFYQWYFNDVALPGQTGPSLYLAYVRCTEQGQYRVSAWNTLGSAMSRTASLTVQADTVAPSIISAGSLDGNTIGVVFSEPVSLNASGFKNADNWRILDTNIQAHLVDGGGNPTYYDYPVTNVFAYPDPTAEYSDRVVLVLGGGGQYSPAIRGQFSVECKYYVDNSCATNQGTVEILNSATIDLSQVDISGPLPAGSYFAGASNRVQVTAGGYDVWGTWDQFTFLQRVVEGDFDARVTVVGIPDPAAVPPNVWSKGGLMLRQTILGDLATNSPMAYIVATPTNGVNVFAGGIRTTNGGGAADLGSGTRQTITGVFPENAYPVQLRMVRQGTNVSIYYAGYVTNVVTDPDTQVSTTNLTSDWILVGTASPADWPSQMYLGIMTTSHQQGAGVNATYQDFQILPVDVGPYALAITRTATEVVVSWPNKSGWTLQTSATLSLNPADWVDYTGAKGNDGTNWTVTFPLDTPIQFFRLKK